MTEIRPLVHGPDIAATVERMLPTVRSSAELQRWCTEIAVSMRADLDALRQLEGRVIAAYRAAGLLGDVPDPTTTELLAMMETP